MFDDNENAEDQMSDALVEGCLFAVGALLLVGFLVATIVKVWW